MKLKKLWKAVENHNNKRNKKDIYNVKKKRDIYNDFLSKNSIKEIFFSKGGDGP